MNTPDEPTNGTPQGALPPGGVPPAFEIRIMIAAKDGRVSVQGNAPPRVQIGVLTEAIVALARQMEKDEKATLVKPVSGAMPPLRRL